MDQITDNQKDLHKRGIDLMEMANEDRMMIETLKMKLNYLDRTAEYGKHLIGKLLIDQGRKYAVCPNCLNETDLPSNKASMLVCQHLTDKGNICNTTLWMKDKQTNK